MLSELDQRRLTMLHVAIWAADSVGWTLPDAEAKLRHNSATVRDLQSILRYRLSHTHTLPGAFVSDIAGPLAIHLALRTRWSA